MEKNIYNYKPCTKWVGRVAWGDSSQISTHWVSFFAGWVGTSCLWLVWIEQNRAQYSAKQRMGIALHLPPSLSTVGLACHLPLKGQNRISFSCDISNFDDILEKLRYDWENALMDKYWIFLKMLPNIYDRVWEQSNYWAKQSFELG